MDDFLHWLQWLLWNQRGPWSLVLYIAASLVAAALWDLIKRFYRASINALDNFRRKPRFDEHELNIIHDFLDAQRLNAQENCEFRIDPATDYIETTKQPIPRQFKLKLKAWWLRQDTLSMKQLAKIVSQPTATGLTCALIGDPASGKTVEMIKISLELARRWKRKPGRPLPVLILVNSLAKATIDKICSGQEVAIHEIVFEYLRNARGRLRTVTKFPDRFLDLWQERWVEMRPVLLFDAVDEFPDKDRYERLITALSEAAKNSRKRFTLVISCREDDFSKRTNFVPIRILPLSRRQIIAHYRQAGLGLEVERGLEIASARLAHYMTNVYFLRLFLDWYSDPERKTQDIPARLDDLFDKLFLRELNKLRHDPTPEKVGAYLQDSLAPIAYHLTLRWLPEPEDSVGQSGALSGSLPVYSQRLLAAMTPVLTGSRQLSDWRLACWEHIKSPASSTVLDLSDEVGNDELLGDFLDHNRFREQQDLDTLASEAIHWVRSWGYERLVEGGDSEICDILRTHLISVFADRPADQRKFAAIQAVLSLRALTWAIRAGILRDDPVTGDIVKFRHQRIREYLTARYIETNEAAGFARGVYTENFWWQQTVNMLVAISRNPQQLLRDLLHPRSRGDGTAQSKPEAKRVLVAAQCIQYLPDSYESCEAQVREIEAELRSLAEGGAEIHPIDRIQALREMCPAVAAGVVQVDDGLFRLLTSGVFQTSTRQQAFNTLHAALRTRKRRRLRVLFPALLAVVHGYIFSDPDEPPRPLARKEPLAIRLALAVLHRTAFLFRLVPSLAWILCMGYWSIRVLWDPLLLKKPSFLVFGAVLFGLAFDRTKFSGNSAYTLERAITFPLENMARLWFAAHRLAKSGLRRSHAAISWSLQALRTAGWKILVAGLRGSQALGRWLLHLPGKVLAVFLRVIRAVVGAIGRFFARLLATRRAEVLLPPPERKQRRRQAPGRRPLLEAGWGGEVRFSFTEFFHVVLLALLTPFLLLWRLLAWLISGLAAAIKTVLHNLRDSVQWIVSHWRAVAVSLVVVSAVTLGSWFAYRFVAIPVTEWVSQQSMAWEVRLRGEELARRREESESFRLELEEFRTQLPDFDRLPVDNAQQPQRIASDLASLASDSLEARLSAFEARWKGMKPDSAMLIGQARELVTRLSASPVQANRVGSAEFERTIADYEGERAGTETVLRQTQREWHDLENVAGSFRDWLELESHIDENDKLIHEAMPTARQGGIAAEVTLGKLRASLDDLDSAYRRWRRRADTIVPAVLNLLLGQLEAAGTDRLSRNKDELKALQQIAEEASRRQEPTPPPQPPQTVARQPTTPTPPVTSGAQQRFQKEALGPVAQRIEALSELAGYRTALLRNEADSEGDLAWETLLKIATQWPVGDLPSQLTNLQKEITALEERLRQLGTERPSGVGKTSVEPWQVAAARRVAELQIGFEEVRGELGTAESGLRATLPDLAEQGRQGLDQWHEKLSNELQHIRSFLDDWERSDKRVADHSRRGSELASQISDLETKDPFSWWWGEAERAMKEAAVFCADSDRLMAHRDAERNVAVADLLQLVITGFNQRVGECQMIISGALQRASDLGERFQRACQQFSESSIAEEVTLLGNRIEDAGFENTASDDVLAQLVEQVSAAAENAQREFRRWVVFFISAVLFIVLIVLFPLRAWLHTREINTLERKYVLQGSRRRRRDMLLEAIERKPYMRTRVVAADKLSDMALDEPQDREKVLATTERLENRRGSRDVESAARLYAIAEQIQKRIQRSTRSLRRRQVERRHQKEGEKQGDREDPRDRAPSGCGKS